MELVYLGDANAALKHADDARALQPGFSDALALSGDVRSVIARRTSVPSERERLRTEAIAAYRSALDHAKAEQKDTLSLAIARLYWESRDRENALQKLASNLEQAAGPRRAEFLALRDQILESQPVQPRPIDLTRRE